jgi:hypothetical protein
MRNNDNITIATKAAFPVFFLAQQKSSNSYIIRRDFGKLSEIT